MATYTDITDWNGLQPGDIINYTTSGLTIDAKGFKFGCRLKGLTRGAAYGANCYAEFDFSSVNDGNITLGNNYGSYLAITNGTGTSILYNRIMVAGDAGNQTNSNAGVFGGSGASGFNGRGYAYGGTQSSGGTRAYGEYLSGAGGSFGYAPDNAGNGWYGGAYCVDTLSFAKYSYGGGSSYLLTSDSYKPAGYMPEWTSIVDLISNPSSSVLTSARDYYCTITIIETGGGSARTIKYYDGESFIECSVKYYTGTEFIDVNPHIYNGTDWD